MSKRTNARVNAKRPHTKAEQNTQNYHLEVYADRTELIVPGQAPQIFLEGRNGATAKQRLNKIITALKGGFLVEEIQACKNSPAKVDLSSIPAQSRQILDGIVGGMTSEVGRALIGLSVLQLTIKAIEPNQSIRLHKSSANGRGFGWQEGLSMRSLDAQYITPTLRQAGLLKLNSFGIFMTRSLAENYPYTRVYKAAVRGGRREWLELVEALESNSIRALPALHYLILKLLKSLDSFEQLAQRTIKAMMERISRGDYRDPDEVLTLIERHISESKYAARIMEIAMHSLMQAIQETGGFGTATLVPLSQMRSANKKHGNIGDIELSADGEIIEAWDAKYGKSYLRDELEELNDKLASHAGVDQVGFVTSEEPLLSEELQDRIREIEEIHGVTLSISSLKDWVESQFRRSEEFAGRAELARKWIKAYTETIALRRLKLAPIDEPGFHWLSSLLELFTSGEKDD